MNIAFIGCLVMNREISYEVSMSKNKVRAWWLQQGLHDTPKLLKGSLQKTIDDIELYQKTLDNRNKIDYICLGYGLCSEGVLDIICRSIPLVIPRCDDCISLFLGSADRYRKLFETYSGAYWYNPGWIEHAFTPSKQSYQELREKYLLQYDEETVDYLMNESTNWAIKYNYGVYIKSPVYDCQEYEDYAFKAAKDFGWKFRKEQGSMRLFNNLLNGPWSEKDFLICLPGKKIVRDYSFAKIKSESLAK